MRLDGIKDIARKTLFDMKDTLDELDIEVFLLQGTLLGAVRDNGFAPGDEDLDLGTNIYNLAPKMRELINRLKTKGFRATLFDRPYRFYVHAKIIRSPVRIDLVSFDFNGDKAFRLGGKYQNKAKVYDRKLITTLKEIDFLGRKFNIFSDAEKWLEIEYGTNWRKREKRSGKFTSAWVKDYWKSYVLKNQGLDYGKNIADILKHKDKV